MANDGRNSLWLEPLETSGFGGKNLPRPTAPDPAPSPGFAAGWDAPDLLQAPSEVRAHYAPRVGRAHASKKWGPRHASRSKSVTQLVHAGYVARRYPIAADPVTFDKDGEPCPTVYRYQAGPCSGRVVSDPWVDAAKLAWCGVSAVCAPTTGGRGGSVTSSPERCGLVHACPVCASAAGTEDALRLVAIINRPGRTGAVVLDTRTHQDLPPGQETLPEAWERFEDALTLDRIASRDQVYGSKLTLETTDGENHNTTHPHSHGISELMPGDGDVDRYRDDRAKCWAESTRLAGGGRVVDQAKREVEKAKDWAESRADVALRARDKALLAAARAAEHPKQRRLAKREASALALASARARDAERATWEAERATAAVAVVSDLQTGPWRRVSGFDKQGKESWCRVIAPAPHVDRCAALVDDDCDSWTLLHYDACGNDPSEYGVVALDTCEGDPPAATCGARCEREPWDILPPRPPTLADPTDPVQVKAYGEAMKAWHVGPRAEWAKHTRSTTFAVDGAADKAVRDAAFQACKYPCPLAEIKDPACVFEFVTWAHEKHLVRWRGEYDNPAAYAWAGEVVNYEADEMRRLAVPEGGARDIGWRLPGVKPTRGNMAQLAAQLVAAKAAEPEAPAVIAFEAPATGMHLYRLVSDVLDGEAWDRMAGIMHRLDPVLVDTRSEAECHELRQRFKAWKLRPDIPEAVAEWEVARVELGLDQWTEAALNERDHERARREAFEASLPPPVPCPGWWPDMLLTEADRVRIRAAVAAEYDRLPPS